MCSNWYGIWFHAWDVYTQWNLMYPLPGAHNPEPILGYGLLPLHILYLAMYTLILVTGIKK